MNGATPEEVRENGPVLGFFFFCILNKSSFFLVVLSE